MGYDRTWCSLERHSIPDWFRDEPFGIYFHWGPYSVPAYGNEWYPREMYQEGSDIHEHHVETYGDPGEYGYHEFVPDFHGDATRLDVRRGTDRGEFGRVRGSDERLLHRRGRSLPSR